jgi:protein-S-isoprenylcysteine O-methyltransferase Ste14
MTQSQGQQGFQSRGGWWPAAQIPLMLLAYFIPDWTGPVSPPPFAMASWVAGTGLALVLAGAALVVAGMAALGRSLTPFPRPVENAVLRTGGVYALVRHPIYSGILFLAVGWSVYRFSLAGLGFDLLLFVFFDRKASREERWLTERFPGYAKYRGRVRKLIVGVY